MPGFGAVARAGLRGTLPVASRVVTASDRARRSLLIAKAKASAELRHATLDIEIAPDVRVDRQVRIDIVPWTHNVLRIGAGSSLHEGVFIRLGGGTALIGPDTEVRRYVSLNVSGHLDIKGNTGISWNSVIHCSGEIVLEEMAGLAEQVTIADVSHYFTTPDAFFWHNVRAGSVHVGRNTWLCPKSTLVRGARVGSNCIVASNSVVTGEVPDGSLASGVPATVKPLRLPWT